MLNDKLSLPNTDRALAGRNQAIHLNNVHFVHGRPIQPPFVDAPNELHTIYLGLGCFWGAERLFWQIEGVYTTAVGYTGGLTPNPTYQELCSGLTGHNEVVMVVYDPAIVSLNDLLKSFFEAHDPTQGMRQGNDIGTQYRSGIYVTNATQLDTAQQVRQSFQNALNNTGHGTITTEIASLDDFYYAEEYHQQYLAKNPNGYCGLRGLGVSCAIE